MDRFSTLCTACAGAPKVVLQLVPDRFEEDPPYTYEALCPLCLDEFLGVYPKLHRLLLRRELTGARIVPHRTRFAR